MFFHRWSWFISGLGHITLPSSTDEPWITGGRYGLVFADDVHTSGHFTSFPSKDETVLLGLPTANSKQPEHEVLHEGACNLDDLIGGIDQNPCDECAKQNRSQVVART